MSEKFYDKYIEKKNVSGGRGDDARGNHAAGGAVRKAGGRADGAGGRAERAGGKKSTINAAVKATGRAVSAGGRGDDARGNHAAGGAVRNAGASRAGERKMFGASEGLRNQAEKKAGLFLAAGRDVVLENFDEVVQGVRPLNSKQLQQLPEKIRALSHQLTDERSTRRLGYMNDNVQLSAYVRYYTWWNLVRLSRLFANLPGEAFPGARAGVNDAAGGVSASTSNEIVCLDLGSGPLTVVIALWLARPELRNLPMTWYCLDVSANSMALGEDVFLSVVARTGGEPWKIIRVKGSFGTNIKQKADLVTCANMFNELDQASDMPPEFKAKKYYDQLRAYSNPYAKFLLVEPGVPKAARTLSLLRERFIRDNLQIVAPCPHAGECPMNGFKAYTGSQHKWCNFAFNTDDAPARLLKLSSLSKLPKERATLSFISVNGEGVSVSADKATSPLLCRVASDQFRMPGNKTGVYACTRLGLALLESSADRAPSSGDLLLVKIKSPDSLPCDKKSGAVLIEC